MKNKKGFLIAAIILSVISIYLIIGTAIRLSQYDIKEILLLLFIIVIFSIASILLFKKYFAIKKQDIGQESTVTSKIEKLSNRGTKNMSVSRRKQMPKGLAVGGVVIAIFILCAGAGLYQILSNPEDYNTNPIYNYSEEEISEINTILTQCGIEEDYTAERDESLDNMNYDGEMGYRISSDGINNIILYVLDGQATMVRYADRTLYDNGEAIDNISNYALTDSEEVQYYTNAEKAVTSVLTSPSTADFGSILESYISKDNGVVTVQGYVDSQNSFGTVVRSNFKVQFDDNSIISLIIDGTEYLQ